MDSRTTIRANFGECVYIYLGLYLNLNTNIDSMAIDCINRACVYERYN